MTAGNVLHPRFNTQGEGIEVLRRWGGDDRPSTITPRLTPTYPSSPREYFVNRQGRIVPQGSAGSIRIQPRPLKRDTPVVRNPEYSKPNRYTTDSFRYVMPSGTLYGSNGVATGQSPSKLYFYNQNWTFFDARDKWDVDTKCLEKIYDAVAGSGFNASVFASQTTQTLDGITAAAKSIASSLLYLRKGKFRDACQALTNIRHPGQDGFVASAKDLGGRWLELQYGWLPLLSDVHESAHLLAHQVNQVYKPGSRVVERAGKFRVNRLDVGPVLGTENVKYRCQTIAHVIPVSVPDLLGLSDPLSVVWENVPYSFVVDWFYPIGDYLTALSHSNAMRGEFIQTRTEKSEIVFGRYQGGSWYLEPDGPCTSSYSVVNRTVGNTIPVSIPPFQMVEIPSFKRCLNAVSLLLQKL